MKRILVFGIMIFATSTTYSFTSIYVGWENFINPALPVETKADNASIGIVGNTPTRVYFQYNILANIVFTRGAVQGNLGGGVDLAAGVGYRFLNSAHKRSGWDIGMDVFGYVAPYILKSETTYFEVAIYYGVGAGFNFVYKINPYIGVGIRAGMKYNIGINSLAAKTPSAQGILFNIGTLLTF